MNTKIKDPDSFNFFVPASFEKGTERLPDGTEVPVLRVRGIASDDSKDWDEEILEPDGFDLDYFNKYGLINWNHTSKTSPKGIIGEPTRSWIQDNKMHVEGVLYPQLELAQDVFTLAETLEQNGSTRRLGWSIEGKATLRDPMNKKRIKKAKITGIAITASPKNSNTLLEVVKGVCDSPYCEYEYEVEDTLSKGDDSNGGTVFIIDIEAGGKRLTVDKEFNIKIVELNKALTTETGSALKRADVEGHPKVLDWNGSKEDREKLAVVTLSKAIEYNFLTASGTKKVKEFFRQKVQK